MRSSTRPALLPRIAYLVALLGSLAARSARAELISISLDPLLGSYVLGQPGRSVQFDLGTKFFSVRGATLALTGTGEPGLFEQCHPFSGGVCHQFQAGPSALYIVQSEGPGFFPFYGSFDFGEAEATRTALLVGDPEDRAVFLDGKGQIVLTHNDLSSIPEEPISVLVPWQFSISQAVLSVDGVRRRGVDFEDVALPPGKLGPRVPEVASGGYRFTSPDGGLRLTNATLSADDGSTYLIQDPGEGAQTIVMARADGQPFSLVDFGVAEWQVSSAIRIFVRGLRADGSEVARTIVLDGIFDGTGSQRDFETIRLDRPWAGLAQVSFVGEAQDGGLFALDDLGAPPAEDLDGDGADDAFDTCPGLADPDQSDADGDGVGDACNSLEDRDGDDWADGLDNCPSLPNPDQSNRDGDAHGDACDFCPDYALFTNVDSDGNGIGNSCECGDQTQDGTVDVRDLPAISRAIMGAVPVSPLCDTNDDRLCDVSDIVGANLKIFGQPAYCSRYPRPAP